ncbi:WXG100 family type VII secretion target [Microcella sp.]|uniref:WXG100 family type VII secretion target n=1 Tax=Microcella sp. TaxID=1913979 RepID=UPI00299F7056|nr:WXG100 family type VII secretion target [Microcella sp.]MDX2025240.1 WXG100 family type VII secretion target [Microcella sp.]
MTRYQVDSEAVIAATGATRGSIGRLQAEAAALHGNLAGLQNTWSGSAATAFHGLVSEWMAAYQRVEQTLTAINEALAHAGQGYAEVEQQAARMFMR